MKKSLWRDSVQLPEFAALEGDIQTEVLVIGGGMAGLLCADRLCRAGVKVCLAEADTICSGVTQNTTAKITAQHGFIYAQLIRSVGVDAAQMYWQANEAALQEYRILCREINCDFEEKDAFVYSRENRREMEEEFEALQKIGSPAQFHEKLSLPFSVAGAVCLPRQAQFHPLKFAAALAAKLPIYEHTRVQKIDGKVAVTDRGRIRAEQIIVATHFPFLSLTGLYPLKLYQERSYVLALENAPDVGGMYIDAKTGGLSLRNAEGLLLVGCGAHRTGKKHCAWREASDFARWYFPKAREKYRWATQDCMTLDSIPYIGQYAKSTPHLLVATGFQKWGMTTSMAAATILTDQICGRKNPYAAVFSPQRSMLHLQLAKNIWEASVGLFTPTVRRCSHLGGALHWNPQEHSWDCSCHGSRFDADGHLINEPAAGDAVGVSDRSGS